MRPGLQLELLDPPPGRGPWFPYGMTGEDHEGFSLQWWQKSFWSGAPNRRFFVLRNETGEQVARLHLDLDAPIDLYPTARPVRPVLEVQYVEVRSDLRGDGLGPGLINRVRSRYPDHQFMALSAANADGFWTSLGWTRHRHVDDNGTTELYQSMFLSA